MKRNLPNLMGPLVSPNGSTSNRLSVYFNFPILLLISFFIISQGNVNAQCSNCTSQWPGATQSIGANVASQNITTCSYGGEYSVCNVVAGTTYTWSTCGDTDFDTQITVRDNNGGCFGTVRAYNDDACGTQSSASWTATYTGTVRVLISRYNCTTQSSCMTVNWSSSTPVSCTDTEVTLTMNDSYGDGWNGGSITLSNDLGDTFGPYTIASGSSGTESLCLPDACYDISVAGGSYPGEMSWSLDNGTSGGGTYGSQSAVFATGSASCGVPGCTDPTAANYNPAATLNDGSCIYAVTPPFCYDMNGSTGGFSNGSGGLAWNSGGTSTPSTGTGPQGADASGGSGFYFTESSGINSQTYAMTGIFDLSAGGYSMTFDYHMYGATMGNLQVLVNGNVEFSVAGNQGNAWLSGAIDLSAYTGSAVDISIRSTTGTSYTSDCAIDNICIQTGPVTISGCMDPTALNYNPAATVDDGSCSYPVAGDNCSIAIDLATLTSPYSGTTVGATNVFTNSCLNGSAGDLLFKIDVADGEVLYIGQRSNGYDSKHRIAYGGACPGVTEINTGYAGIFPTTSTTGTTSGCLDDNDLTHYYFNNNTGSTQTVYWTQDCFSSSQGTFELEWQLIAPPSNPTGVTASASTICEGESTTLTASGASGTTYWFAGSCATSGEVGTGASLSVSPTTTTTYYARNNNGAFSAGCASITISVDAAPSVNAGVDQEVCEGTSVTLAASGADSYSWDNGISDGVAFTATTTTTYTVTGTVSGNACPGTDDVVVTVNALPVVDAGTDETICEGSSVQLAATATSTSGTLATTQAGGNGCGGGNMFDITAGGNQVTVNGFTITPNTTSVQNVLVYYRVGSYVGNTTNSAAWTLLGTYSVNGVSGSQVYMPTGDIVIPAGATYGIYVQYSAQYTSGAFTYSNSDITITTGQGHCSAFDGCCSPRTFNGIVHYSTGSITWSPSATLSSASILDPIASPSSTTTYTLVVTSKGCSSSDNVDVNVDANPFAANAGEDKPACINNSATLSASNPPVGSGTWTWSPSAPTYAGGTSASDYNAQVVFNAVGQYTGTWTVTNGICTSTPDDAVVTVTSANNNASLFASAGAAQESIFAFEVCEEGAWTYYAASAAPEEYLFAINKNGNSFSAVVSITDLPSTTPISSLGGNQQIRGTWLIGRYWNVELFSGSVTTPVDIRFFVDPAEVTQAENDANTFLNNTALATNITPLTFFKTVSAAFDPATDLVNGEFTFAPVYLPYTTGTLNGVTYYELTGLTSFSGGTGGFSVNDSGSPLPVELLGFDVNAVDNQFIRLDWATASEINNEGFEVLRSTDGVNFERIAWIDGNGNSTEINEYVFNDRGVDKGMTYYYQLKQIDYDGQYEYFDIKSARLDGKTTFTVGALIPNPSKGNDIVSVDVSTSSGELLTVEIYDRIGAKVKSASYVLFAADNVLDINIADLAEGTYFLNFESSMGTETRKLVVLK